jgi:hypothetical protein
MFKSITDAYMATSDDMKDEFETAIGAIDWNSPLTSLKNLNTLIEEGDEATAAFA